MFLTKPLHVLHVYKTALPESIGGVEVVLDTLCNATADFNVANTILCLSEQPSNAPINMGKYTVVQAKQNLFIASTGFSWSAFAKFRKLAADADIIHYHFPNPFADLLHLVCRIKKPSIITYHSDIIKQKYLKKLYQPLMKKLLKSVRQIIATSPHYLATSQDLQDFHHKTTVIPLGLNNTALPSVDQTRVDYWRQRLPEKFFLFVGKLRYYKGLHFALDAIKDTNLQLVIVGDGGIEASLKEYAHTHNLFNAHFLGALSDADKAILYNLCYAFVFPSHLRSEAFGVSLLEAAAAAKPLISCEIGTGTSYVNIDGLTGLVVKPACVNSLRDAMQSLQENPTKTMEFGQNAANRYAQLFTAQKQAQEYLHVYQEVLAGYHV